MSNIEGVSLISGEGVTYPPFVTITEQSENSSVAPQASDTDTTLRMYSGDDEVCAQGSSTRKPPVPFQSVWRSATSSGIATPAEEAVQDQDALLALGRMVRGGAKTLWRRVSKGSLRGRDPTKKGHVTGEQDGEGAEVEVAIVGVGITKRSVLRRSVSEPPSPSTIEGSGNLTVRVLVKEPRHLLTEEPAKASASEDGGKPSHAPPQAAEYEEQGRVWEEEIGEDVTRRMQALSEAQAQEKTKERGSSLVRRIASLRGTHRPR